MNILNSKCEGSWICFDFAILLPQLYKLSAGKVCIRVRGPFCRSFPSNLDDNRRGLLGLPPAATTDMMLWKTGHVK